jgi:hypothetical protein
VDIGLGKLLDGTILLVQRRFPNSDTEGMRLVDGLLAVLEREALGVADVAIAVLIRIDLEMFVLVIIDNVVRRRLLFENFRLDIDTVVGLGSGQRAGSRGATPRSVAHRNFPSHGSIGLDFVGIIVGGEDIPSMGRGG